MKYELLLVPSAEADVDRIIRYLAEHSRRRLAGWKPGADHRSCVPQTWLGQIPESAAWTVLALGHHFRYSVQKYIIILGGPR
jgi:hypothetical protein